MEGVDNEPEPAPAPTRVQERFLCYVCGISLSRKSNLDRHIDRLHSGLPEVFRCEYCKMTFSERQHFEEHVKQHKPTKKFTPAAHSLKIASQYERVFGRAASLDYVFADRRGIIEVLQHELLRKNVVKAAINLECTFVKRGPDGTIIDRLPEVILHSKYYTLYRMQALNKFVKSCKADIFKRFEDLTLRGSNWILQRIHLMRISTVKIKDLIGGCENASKISVNKMYRGRYLTNPPSFDNGCFYYCIAHHLTKSEDVNTLTAFIHKNIRPINNDKEFKNAVRISQIAKFERVNKHLDLAINVVMCDNEVLFPLYNSKRRDAANQISLLLHFAETLQDVGHYIYIKDFNKYASHSYVTKDNKTAYIPGFYCHGCLQRFKRKATYEAHVEVCKERKTQRVIIPEPNSFMEFNALRKSYPLPLIALCDMESAMRECEYCNICMDARECPHSTTYVNQHEAFAFCLLIFDRNNEVVLDFTYAGDDCVEKLLNYLLDHEAMLTELFFKNLPMVMTESDKAHFQTTNQCVLCGKDFDRLDVRAAHHEHYTSKYIGPTHQDCNLNARLYDCQIPIFFHNLSGYDINFIVKALSKVESGRIQKLEVMPHNTEKIRKMDINCFQFMDSMDFLSGSLAAITNDLVLSNHDFPLLAKTNMYETEEQKQLLLRKGVFPYSLVRDHVQLLGITSLPPKEAFYSDLSQHELSDEDYAHAQAVWDAFKCRDLLDFMFLYLRLDTILLSESLIKFRTLLINEVSLDPCQFLSTPHLSFHLMLKISQVKLEYLSDPGMIDMLDSSIRGGHSFTNIRHTEKNEKENIHLAYWDCKLLLLL